MNSSPTSIGRSLAIAFHYFKFRGHAMHASRAVCGLLVLCWAGWPAFAVESKDGYFQTSDGIKIHYIEAGSRTAPGKPVVLIHGYTGNARGNWFTNGVADALAARH